MSGDALISDGVKDLMVAASIGIFEPDAIDETVEWQIVISRIRDKPNKMIAVYDTGGFDPDPALDINYPTVQIVVRGEPNGYKDAHRKARDIKNLFLGREAGIVNGDIWAGVEMMGDVVSLGYDDNERPQLSLNFRLYVHQGDLTGSSRMHLDG